MADNEIREAAEHLLGSFSPTQARSISHSHSVNMITEELVAGHRHGGRMSSVRRFFCLLVTFDLLFTSLMWLICVMIRGTTLVEIFDAEVVHYNIKSSLFDIVMVAACRFTVLLLFYALLYINNWSVIALSTGCTCAFLIAKVFVYDWVTAKEPVYHVFLILTSFTLSWGEAWFLDFRVLPQELQAKHILSTIAQHGVASERAPLLAGRGHTAASAYGESTVNWFSPVETPETSPRPRRPGEQIILTCDQIDEYKRTAAASVGGCWRVARAPGWRLEKRGPLRGDVVESITTKELGKVFRFTGTVECPAKWLYEDLRENFTRMPEWNPTILKTELIKVLGAGVDLTYQVTAGGGKGLITPRDFVMLRQTCRVRADGEIIAEERSDVEPDAYISCGVSVECPGYPPVAEYVRGNTKVGCWFMRPAVHKTSSGRLEDRCIFQWLFSCDLKGRMPQFVIDTAFATVMVENVIHIRKHAADARAKGVF